MKPTLRLLANRVRAILAGLYAADAHERLSPLQRVSLASK